ncbi:hypothetical protein BU24DRAFT_457799 [Aaosphaeria arxii CBS 175.79]|uniref:Aminoglycoside phosphotransferase domain-containing protein n=1 Tax=Aaosphaeria arxii CBS 175.79 TaxID=1450172 RepID=A0A6A5Y9E0_9PLEO|nr:uncharacterized protein BU24DRAFT_457799 [Aaosphaeria arxii CBS 175.79]KAF2021876.1 hypothetical protein BU24DRAFT_457799 [Aaosphaeria arxii CBS 175.79]
MSEEDRKNLQTMMRIQDRPWSLPRFSHGDLNPFNVLVWGFSGWYPPYWEHTSAWFGNATRMKWQGRLDKILDRPRSEEFKMEEVPAEASYWEAARSPYTPTYGFGFNNTAA